MELRDISPAQTLITVNVKDLWYNVLLLRIIICVMEYGANWQEKFAMLQNKLQVDMRSVFSKAEFHAHVQEISAAVVHKTPQTVYILCNIVTYLDCFSNNRH